MSDGGSYVPRGFGAIRPHVYGHPELIELTTRAFGAIELARHPAGTGATTIEAQIGDSLVVLELGDPPPHGRMPSSILVYVPDTDAAYARAIECGAAPLLAPHDRRGDERAASVRDRFGNEWWMSTHHRPLAPGRAAT